MKLLAGEKAVQDADYREFLRRTGFDYTRDLDLALVAFAPRANYFLLKGRFDWPRLEAYAAQSGGACAEGVCRMPGSKPERNISYRRLRGNLVRLEHAGNVERVVYILRDVFHPEEQVYKYGFMPARLKSVAYERAGRKRYVTLAGEPPGQNNNIHNNNRLILLPRQAACCRACIYPANNT
jgi:hypothetical protein